MKKKPLGMEGPNGPKSLRKFESDLKIEAREGPGAWESDYESVQNLLDHLQRYTESMGTRRDYLTTIRRFCRETELDPDELIELRTGE
ncbi:hypothetical protein AKJ52_02270, partial [candidate division MSBL1 archaeon SCGC-AAA382C18]